jgi:hypothetical protein
MVLKYAIRINKVEKLRDHGNMDLEYSGFVNNVGMKREWILQPRATWVALLGKRRSLRVMTKR